MGTYILCRRQPAGSPFYINCVHLNIYSLEELCYFLSSNLALAEETVSDKKLPEWLEKECGLEGAVREFEKSGEAEGSVGGRLMWIFSKSHYFNENELRSLKTKTAALDTTPPAQRQKSKGDALVKYGKYKRGIACYERILEMDGIDGETDRFRSSVYYNIGVAYEKMFQSGKALDFFYKALQCSKTPENLSAYLYAAYFDGGKAELTAQAKKLGIKDSVIISHLDRAEAVKPYDRPADKDKAIDEWIRAYHISVDQ